MLLLLRSDSANSTNSPAPATPPLLLRHRKQGSTGASSSLGWDTLVNNLVATATSTGQISNFVAIAIRFRSDLTAICCDCAMTSKQLRGAFVAIANPFHDDCGAIKE
jgi:hypothetical protein